MDRVTPVSEKIRTRLTLVRIVVLLTTGELASRAGCNLSSGGRDRSRRASGFPTTQPPTVVEWSGATSLHSPPNADGEQPADTGPYSRTLPPPRASDATGPERLRVRAMSVAWVPLRSSSVASGAGLRWTYVPSGCMSQA